MFPEGVIYEGVGDEKPQYYRGESGANDSMSVGWLVLGNYWTNLLSYPGSLSVIICSRSLHPSHRMSWRLSFVTSVSIARPLSVNISSLSRLEPASPKSKHLLMPTSRVWAFTCWTLIRCAIVLHWLYDVLKPHLLSDTRVQKPPLVLYQGIYNQAFGLRHRDR